MQLAVRRERLVAAGEACVCVGRETKSQAMSKPKAGDSVVFLRSPETRENTLTTKRKRKFEAVCLTGWTVSDAKFSSTKAQWLSSPQRYLIRK